MIIGLDCAEPSLVLDRWRERAADLSASSSGAYGRADLGRAADHRARLVLHDVQPHARRSRRLRLPQPLRPLLRRPLHRQLLGDQGAAPLGLGDAHGKPSIVLGVPGTYPPRPLNGVMVSCFLTPSRESQYTYPPMLAREVEQVVGEYLFDCTDFRTDDKDDLCARSTR